MPNSEAKAMNLKNSVEKREKGQALVEFAMVALLFFTLVFGIIEFGRALWTWNTIVQATRAGARFAAVEVPTNDDMRIMKVVAYNDPNAGTSSTPVVPGLTEANIRVRYLNNDGTVAASKNLADLIEISVINYQFTFLVPIFGSQIALPSFTTSLPLEGLGAT